MTFFFQGVGGVDKVKNGCDYSDHRTLNLPAFLKGIDGITDFLLTFTNSLRVEVTCLIFGCK